MPFTSKTKIRTRSKCPLLVKPKIGLRVNAFLLVNPKLGLGVNVFFPVKQKLRKREREREISRNGKVSCGPGAKISRAMLS